MVTRDVKLDMRRHCAVEWYFHPTATSSVDVIWPLVNINHFRRPVDCILGRVAVELTARSWIEVLQSSRRKWAH